MRTIAGVALALLALAGCGGSDGNPTPGPTESPSAADGWTPERIRAEGSPEDIVPTTESGLAARLYLECDGPHCDSADGAPDTIDGPPVDMHVALEVIRAGRSAVFDLHWSVYPWVRAFDDDSVLVRDGDGSGQPVRYRLLQADGTAVNLQLLNDPAPAVPRPGVVVIDSSAIFTGTEELYLVDDRAGTVQPLDVPEEVRYWGPNIDEFLWGVTSDCRVFWATDGTVENRRLDCRDGLDFTFIDDEWFPDGWLRPGRMAVAQQWHVDRTVLHVSLDSGATWQKVPVKDEGTIASVLRQLG